MPEEYDDSDLRARSFWSGTLTFGLVSIPVNLFPGNRSQGVSLRMLDQDGTPLSRRYFCSKEERELDADEIVRGYELDGQYIVITDEELEALEPKKSRDIDLRRFVDQDAIDPIFFERAYYLTPAGGSTKAYRLLAETMERTRKAGIATFVMRGKEYLIAILAEQGILRAETLRFQEEIRSADDVGLPERNGAKKTDVSRISKAIRSLAADELDPAELHDTYAERLLALVAEKQTQEEAVVRPPEVAADEEEDDVIDLMEMIKRSMRGGGRSESERDTRATADARPSSGRRSGDERPLAARSKKELYERARELDIEGRSEMSKEELIRAIERAG